MAIMNHKWNWPWKQNYSARIGLEIRESEYVFCQPQRAGQTRSVRIPRPHKAGSLLQEINEGQFEHRIKPYLPELRELEGYALSCIIPSQLVTNKSLSLPDADENELKSMVEQELYDSPAIDPDDLTFGFSVSLNGQDADHVLVNAAATSRKTMDRLVHQLYACGFDCESIQPLSVGLSNISASYSGTVAVLYWSSFETTLVLCNQGHPQYSRQLRDCSLDQFAIQLESKWGVLPSERNSMIRYLSDTNRPQIPALSPLESFWSEARDGLHTRLIEEVRRTLNFAREQKSISSIERLIIVGPAVRWPGLNLLCEKLDTHCRPASANSSSPWAIGGSDDAVAMAAATTGRAEHVSI